MSARIGIEWFPMDTDAFTDDEKVFDLMDVDDPERGYALFGRWMALLCRVYREGFCIEADRRTVRKIARDLELTVSGFNDFMDELCRAGLVDERLWKVEHVITSRGIQRRWKQATRRYRLTKDLQRWWLLDDEKHAHANADAAELVEMVDQPSATVADTAELVEMVDQPSATVADTAEPVEKVDAERRERGERDKREIRGERDGEKKSDPPSLSEAKPTDPTSCPRCLMSPKPGNGVYLDADGGPHRTAYGALEARYRKVTGRSDFSDLVSSVCDLCPSGCRASPEEVSECHGLMAKAIDKCDGRGRPTALVRKILSEDRSPHG